MCDSAATSCSTTDSGSPKSPDWFVQRLQLDALGPSVGGDRDGRAFFALANVSANVYLQCIPIPCCTIVMQPRDSNGSLAPPLRQ